MNHHEAIRIFSEISRAYPASVTAQSAALALQTKSDRSLPRKLRAMRQDDQAIEQIATIAEHAHKYNKNKRAPTFVNRDILRGVLDSEIEWIPRMTRLRRAALEEILGLHGTFANEKEYDQYVEETYFPFW